MAWLLVVALALTMGSCTKLMGLKVTPRCPDGLPPVLLMHEACPPDSICGYSCLPGRWIKLPCKETCRCR